MHALKKGYASTLLFQLVCLALLLMRGCLFVVNISQERYLFLAPYFPLLLTFE